jgi:hypothetical protein
MVKVPVEVERDFDADSIERRTQFLHDLGVLVAQWNRIEICIEIAIRRLTGLSNAHCSLMMGALQHKAKISILKSLLREKGEIDLISKLNTALSYAKRNSLMHGVLGTEQDYSRFSFFDRKVDNRYKVSVHSFTSDSFHEHVWNFCRLADEVLLDLSIDVDSAAFKQELLAYGKDAQFEGLS